MKNVILKYLTALLLMPIMLCATCANAQDSRYLGGLKPDKALSIMKEQPDVFIIDVRENEWYDGYEQFAENHHIPNSEIEERLNEIPSDRVVILNCGLGWVAPNAYKKIKDSKIKVRQLGFIDGTPLFREYNEWRKSKK